MISEQETITVKPVMCSRSGEEVESKRVSADNLMSSSSVGGTSQTDGQVEDWQSHDHAAEKAITAGTVKSQTEP